MSRGGCFLLGCLFHSLLGPAPVAGKTAAPAPSPAAVSAPASPLLEGSLQLMGEVLEAGTREPIADAIVQIKGGKGEAFGEETFEGYSDESGRFILDELPRVKAPVRVDIVVVAPGYLPYSKTMTLAPGTFTSLRIYLRPRPGKHYALEVETRAGPDEATRYSITLQDIRYLPGTFGDPLRAVENLPGMIRAPFGLSGLILRGHNPQDSGYFVDGLSFPLIFHFVGAVSVLNGDLISTIDYLPGGFSVRYGRLQGGIVDVGIQEDIPGRLHGYADVDLLDSSFYVQGGRGRLSYAFAFRRSYMDLFLTPILEPLIGYQIRAPVYSDAQALITARLSPHLRFMALAATSSDSFALIGENPDGESIPTFEYATDFTRALVRLNMSYAHLKHEFALSFGPERELLAYRYWSEQLNNKTKLYSLRDEWMWEADDTLRLRVGFDGQLKRTTIHLGDEQNADDSAAVFDSWAMAPGLYGDVTWRWLYRLEVQPGLRLDWLQAEEADYRAFVADPRLLMRFKGLPSTTLSLGIGQYSQFPSETEYTKEASLLPSRALQAGLTAAREMGNMWSVVTTLYYSRLGAQIVIPQAEDVPIDEFVIDPSVLYDDTTPLFSNEGDGRAYGIEVMVRRKPGRAWNGWLSYTLSRSERRDDPADAYSLFDFDQTHNLTLVASYAFPSGWSLGGRFRLISGNPYTPWENRYHNLDSGGFVGLEDPTQGVNYARLPPFHALDLRVDRAFVFDTWRLNLSLEVQNAYNRRNVEIPYYNFDYGEQQAIYGLPILPSFGIRGEF